MIDVKIQRPLGDDPPTSRLIYGVGALEGLKMLPDASVQVVATSPPYWGLRDYGVESQVWGGDPECEHKWGGEVVLKGSAQKPGANSQRKGRSNTTEQVAKGRSQGCWCQECGAWRGSLGMEPTPQLFVAHLVLIFREVRRVLRDDGVLWLNLGDSYAAARAGHTHTAHTGVVPASARGENAYGAFRKAKGGGPRDALSIGLKHKDLVGIPWRVALALQDDGWYLRSDIIWAKTSCMPEAVKDRPTKAHEYVFLLTKSPRYFYDQEAIREPTQGTDPRYMAEATPKEREQTASSFAKVGSPTRGLTRKSKGGTRNRRTVWNVKSGLGLVQIREGLSLDERHYVVGELLRLGLL